MTAEKEANAAKLAEAKAVVKEADGLRAEADQSVAEAEEAHKRAARAEAEATSRVQGNDALLKKLLAEQRAMFEKETASACGIICEDSGGGARGEDPSS